LGFDFITDMLVIEIPLDSSINTYEPNNRKKRWIDRAGRSLAEAVRLQTSALLDIDITELNAGFRVRHGDTGICIDIYMYDSLSSGAGYSSGIASQIQELLKGTRAFLSGCTCENACQECLKHYRNSFYHSTLDRHAALDLLGWAEEDILASPIPLDSQQDMLKPLTAILRYYGVDVRFNEDGTIVESGGKTMNLKVFPSMLAAAEEEGTILVRDFDVKYARALAVDHIKTELAIR
jgi:hypothetical protein